MGKRIALHDEITLGSTDLSNLARSWSYESEHEQVDVSGFSATGTNEFLSGQTTQSVTVEFYGSYGSGEVHDTVYPLHRDKDTDTLTIVIDGLLDATEATATLSGLVQVPTYGAGATRGEVDTFEVTFTAGDEDGITFTEDTA
jgi:hypothetical protein